MLVETDPEGAYTLLYDASRLALTAALAVQGLRPTTRGGHVVVGDALRAQRGPKFFPACAALGMKSNTQM